MNFFRVTAPLIIRHPDQTKHLMVEKFPHPEGLLYFEPFWHLGPDPAKVHVARGGFKGDGPWKIGDSVITVAGCHGTDADIALTVSQWQDYLSQNHEDYPNKSVIMEHARAFGAEI